MAQRLYVVLCTVILLATASYGQYTLLDDKLQLDGYFKNEVHGFYDRGSNKDGIYMNRNTVWIEGRFKINSQWSLNTIIRGYYDAAYDTIGVWEGQRKLAEKQGVRWSDDDHILREIYVDGNPFSWLNVRAGRMTVTWGETDAFRVTDIINPLDERWHLNFETFKENVVPLWMGRAIVSLPNPYVNSTNLELIYIPNIEDPSTNQLNLVPGLPWEPPPSDAPAGPLPANVVNRLPKRTGSDFTFGARLQGEFLKIDASLYYLYTYKQDPTPRFDGLTFTDGVPTAINLSYVYPRLNVFGTTASYSWDRLGTVIRYESAYKNGDIQGTTDPKDPSLVVKKDSFKWAIGIDRPTMIPFINPTRSTFISYQLIGNWILGHNRFMQVTGYERWKPHEVEFTHTLLFNPLYFGDTLSPVTLIAYDQSAKAYLISQTLDYRYSDHISVGVGMTNINGSYAGLGTLRRWDEAFTRFTYRF